MMGEVYFRGGRVINRETNMLSNIYMVLLIVFVLLIFPGIIVFMAFADSPLSAPLYSVLCAGVGIALIASLLLLDKKSRVEVMDNGLNLGGRFILWDDIQNVRVWSESYREAEVESTPVIGYGMYGYAYGKTLPTTAIYKKYDYIFLKIFHKYGVEIIYFSKEKYWPFVKTLSRTLNQRNLTPKWLHDLETMRFS